MSANPKAALNALSSPGTLTLGKMAVLCRMDAPILSGDVTDITSTLAALYVIESPFADVVAHADEIERAALAWGGNLEPAEYRAKIKRGLDAVAAFLEMLPRPEASEGDDPKKNRPARERLARGNHGVALPDVRLPRRLRARRAAGRPGRDALALLGAGSRDAEERDAPRGRGGLQTMGH